MGEPLFGPGRPNGPCWTLTDGDARWARPLGCGGLEPRGHGVFAAWLFVGDLSPRAWVVVARALRQMAAEVGARRIEATIRCGAGWKTKAEAYAERLGLSFDARLKSFGPDGADYWLYAGVI